MATNNNRTVNETKASKAESPAKTESVYTAKELASAYKIFNASYEIVATALKLAGKDKATVNETTKIVNAFKNKEVK